MALQTAISFKDNEYEQLRYQLETVGYVEDTYVADGFDDAPVALTTIDGRNFPATFSVPVDSTVTAFIQYSFYGDAATDTANGGLEVVTAFRDGDGDVQLLTATGASVIENGGGATSTITYSADVANQGVDITVAGAASSTNYFLARIKLVCVKKGGLPKKYQTNGTGVVS